MQVHIKKRTVAILAALSYVVLACAVQQSQVDVARHRWWAGLGPVLPHGDFPADCSLCHVGEEWSALREDFQFDHEAETGYALEGSHLQARCILCHNDRGPVATFLSRGCVGCHEDIHYGELGQDCGSCHQERTWRAIGMVEKHYRTRFPLEGAHVATACQRCHPGALVGNFVPTPTECEVCHLDDALNAQNPNHVGLGWLQNCNDCHIPTTWNQAEIGN